MGEVNYPKELGDWYIVDHESGPLRYQLCLWKGAKRTFFTYRQGELFCAYPNTLSTGDVQAAVEDILRQTAVEDILRQIERKEGWPDPAEERRKIGRVLGIPVKAADER